MIESFARAFCVLTGLMLAIASVLHALGVAPWR